MFKINIVYGSAGGNTELVCEKVFEILCEELALKIRDDDHQNLVAENKNFQLQVLKAKLTTPEKSTLCDLFILASPTYGHGQLENYIGAYMAALEKFAAEKNLKGKKGAIIGLGDPKYDDDYHIESAKILSDFMREQEMENVHMPLRISKSPLPFLDNHVARWAKKIAEISKEISKK